MPNELSKNELIKMDIVEKFINNDEDDSAAEENIVIDKAVEVFSKDLNYDELLKEKEEEKK